MGRPPLPLGTYGTLLFAATPSGQVRARVKFRDFDGRVRLVSRIGSSRAAAERALKEALTSRRTPGGTAALTSGSRMTALADAWLAADHGWGPATPPRRPHLASQGWESSAADVVLATPERLVTAPRVSASVGREVPRLRPAGGPRPRRWSSAAGAGSLPR